MTRIYTWHPLRTAGRNYTKVPNPYQVFADPVAVLDAHLDGLAHHLLALAPGVRLGIVEEVLERGPPHRVLRGKGSVSGQMQLSFA